MDWSEEVKASVKKVLTPECTSSDEEDAETHQKRKKVLRWQSDLLTARKRQLDRCHYVRAGPRTKHSLTKYVGLGSFSNRPAPSDAPLWALKVH